MGRNMGGVSTVLFDLDGTLCEQRRPSRGVLATAFDRVGVGPFFTVEEYRREAREMGEREATWTGGRRASSGLRARRGGVRSWDG